LQVWGRPAAVAVPALRVMLKDRSCRGRRDAARALAVLGPAAAEAAPELRDCVGEPDAVLRREAGRALDPIEGPVPLL
jgi:hypothetical protein